MTGRAAGDFGIPLCRRIISEVSESRIRALIQALEGPRHPVAAPAALERAADHIRNFLQSLGHEIEEHRFTEADQEFRNIIGLHRGLCRPDELVIVLAHYDTVDTTPGADDNASGVAVMLELARVLKPLQFSRSVLFVGVSLEENAETTDDRALGRRGSRTLAAFARENGWKIEGVIVLESVAYAGESIVQKAPPGIPVKVPDKGDFIAIVGNEESLGLVQGFAGSIERFQIPLAYLTLAVPGRGEQIPDTRRSDHASFWDQDFKAVMITDTTNFRSPHYHRPSDTLATLNIPFAAEVCRATAGVVMEMGGVLPEMKSEGII